MVDVDAALDSAGVTNERVRAYVRQWAAHTQPARVEVVSAADDARLIEESLAAGEILPAGEGLYYSRSYVKDTARSEERTIVATSNPADQGVYNNWRPAVRDEAAARGADARRVGRQDDVRGAVPDGAARLAARAVRRRRRADRQPHGRPAHDPHGPRRRRSTSTTSTTRTASSAASTSPATWRTSARAPPDDQRYFVTVADERTILHFGSSYGGNALLGKIAHGLRQASYDGWTSGEFLAEQFMLIGIRDKQTGRTYHVCGGFPSASGKTNLAMMVPPAALEDRYEVRFFGDDIAWLWVDPDDGRIYAMNPEYGVFGVAKDTNEATNPDALAAVGAGHRDAVHERRLQRGHAGGLVGGPHARPPADVRLAGLEGRADRRPRRPEQATSRGRTRTAVSPRRWPTSPTSPTDFDDPQGVPIDAIIFGGRTSDREPLIRAITDVAEGVYDGLTLGAEATFAAEGVEGLLRYDPMSMRPFMSYPEGATPRTG